MKIINVYVRGTEMYPSDNHAGYARDHQSVQLNIYLAEEWISHQYTYSLLIKPQDDKSVISSSLSPQDNILTFALPQAVTKCGDLFVQLRAEKDGEIMHSAMMFLYIAPSLNDGPEVIDSYNGLLDGVAYEADMALQDAQEAIENVQTAINQIEPYINQKIQEQNLASEDYVNDAIASITEQLSTPIAMNGWTLQQGDNTPKEVEGYYVISGSFLFAWGRCSQNSIEKVNSSVVINLPEALGNITWATGQVSTAAAGVQGEPYIITAPASGTSAGSKVWITKSKATPLGAFTPSNIYSVESFWFAAVTDAGTPETLLLSAGDVSGGYTAGENIEITNGVISVLTTDTAAQDGTRPITAGGVYTIVGNIESLLETI